MPFNSLLYLLTNIIKFEGFKATNYYFITDNELLIELEKEKLKEVKKVAPELIAMYQAKEKFRDIFESKISRSEIN